MFSHEINLVISMEQHRDRLRLVEQLRLVRQVRQQTMGIAPLYRRILSWAGAQMVRMGTWLQNETARVGTAAIGLTDRG